MQPIQLLNQHLDEIMLGGKTYPRAKVERVYHKLSTPRTTGIFYDKNRIKAGIDPDGQVAFKAHYPEIGEYLEEPRESWSYQTPEELGIERTSPKPVRGLIGMQKAFTTHLRNSDGSIRSGGAGLYYNRPASSHRAEAYVEQGMIPVPKMNYQVLDNRRFQNNPTIAELKLRMDAETNTSNIAEVLREPILARHPQLKTALETIHLPAVKAKNEAMFEYNIDDTVTQINQQIDEIHNLLPYNQEEWTSDHYQMFDQLQGLQEELAFMYE